jgi:hypothetical protein
MHGPCIMEVLLTSPIQNPGQSRRSAIPPMLTVTRTIVVGGRLEIVHSPAVLAVVHWRLRPAPALGLKGRANPGEGVDYLGILKLVCGLTSSMAGVLGGS